MKAALCKSLDGPEGIDIADIAPPEPGPGQVVVAVRAAGLNFMDTLITRGKYQVKPELPFSPAGEIAGRIVELGEGVTQRRVGERVCAYIGHGGAREQVVVSETLAVPIPDRIDDIAAAGVSVTYGTAMHGLCDRAQLKSGEVVAVLGASGGAGLAAVELAHLMGARVIAVASGEKLGICRDHGAADLVDYGHGDLKDKLRGLTHGKGADVIYDCVGGPYAEPALRATAWGGRYLVVGFAAGEIPKLPLNLVMLRGCDVRGVFWGDAVRRDPKAHAANMARVLDWIAAGRLSPRVHATVPLHDIRNAIGMLDRREAAGKVVLTLPG
jgi:NADPH2:quinone reductase